ncbi:sensor histidine kinase [Streptomyces noursei]|uniref:sensor histidine kinase n=1 Tax=Streptomyces noursei TaxID=1971 RepID=UPI00099F6384
MPRRAVTNLFVDALTHGHAADRPAEIQLGVTTGGVLTVGDAGPGIPPALADSLFDRFHSGSGSTGLGLSIAFRVAQAHGGTLTATDSPLGGARFTLRLPTHDNSCMRRCLATRAPHRPRTPASSSVWTRRNTPGTAGC